LLRHPSAPYVAPFAVFIILLSVTRQVRLGWWEFPLWLVAMGLAIWCCSRGVIDLRSPFWLQSSGLGLLVFAVWIAPDALISGYREHWLFQNPITGSLGSTLDPALRNDWSVLALRTFRAVVIVPVVEELFWRAWLMRWLISADFGKLPLGAWSASAFWITALLFAAEHGPYWEVGLVAGIAYNGWMVRTRSLGDCILAHAVTNAALSFYTIATGKWEFWF